MDSEGENNINKKRENILTMTERELTNKEKRKKE